jgi:hypothetical protein
MGYRLSDRDKGMNIGCRMIQKITANLSQSRRDQRERAELNGLRPGKTKRRNQKTELIMKNKSLADQQRSWRP